MFCLLLQSATRVSSGASRFDASHEPGLHQSNAIEQLDAFLQLRWREGSLQRMLMISSKPWIGPMLLGHGQPNSR
jgi:hypothetical protein